MNVENNEIMQEDADALRKELARKEQQLFLLTEANDGLRKYADSLREEADRFRRMADDAVRDREAIKDSEFWKLTKPLRGLSDFVKNLPGGVAIIKRMNQQMSLNCQSDPLMSL